MVHRRTGPLNLILRAGRPSKRLAPSALPAALLLGALLLAAPAATAARPPVDDALLQALDAFEDATATAGTAVLGASGAALAAGQAGTDLAQSGVGDGLSAATDARDGAFGATLAATSVLSGYAQRRMAGLDTLDTPVLLGLDDALSRPLPVVQEDGGVVLGEDIVGVQLILDIFIGEAPDNVAGYAAGSGQAAAEWADETFADTVATAGAFVALP